MRKRQVVLKINTSGASILIGNRIVEIDCVELIDGKLTGREFHKYINPNRFIESSAYNEHGLSYQFLRSHPMFNHIANDFLDFITDADLVIHNASWTTGFINREFQILGLQPLETYCDITNVSKPIRAGIYRIAKILSPLVLPNVQSHGTPIALVQSATQH